MCGVSLEASLHGGSNDTIGGLDDLGGQSYRRFGVERCRWPQGPLIRMFWVSLEAHLHGGSNDTIGGLVRPRRPEISPSSHGGGPMGPR